MELKEAKHILEEKKSLLINSSMPDTSLITAIDTVLEELNKLQKENLEIRDWKYVIDTFEDLDKLKELDIIKVKGKEYISKKMYDELEKDKKALIRNYDKVLNLLNKE